MFKSLMLLDIESSGLPAFGGKTRITEISLIGVLVNHVIDSHDAGRGVPRVLQKLNVCFYPMKRIDFEATELTGLDNLLLEEVPSFNKEACVTIKGFLNLLPTPVCLISHNGMKFDFPLLKAEFSARQEALPEDIVCADSLMAFRSLFPRVQTSSPSSSLKNDVSTRLSTHVPHRPMSNNHVSNEQNSTTEKDVSVSDMQTANETTPKTYKIQACPPLKRKSEEFAHGHTAHDVRKKLFLGQEFPRSHKLSDLYSYLHGRDQVVCHRAENDAMALLECILKSAPEFLNYIEKHHFKFTKIPCMW